MTTQPDDPPTPNELRIFELENALRELVEVADLRGDSDLPHPSNDPKMWSARMQEAWDWARSLIEGPELDAAAAASRKLEV